MPNLWPGVVASKADDLYGKVDDVDDYFQGHPTRPLPWSSVHGRGTKTHRPYDRAKVKEALQQPPTLEDVDPRTLHGTQPSITRVATQHYMQGDHHETGETYADQGNVGNAHPVIYQRDDGVNLILSGHHRAAKALFKGHPLRARVVRGGMEPR